VVIAFKIVMTGTESLTIVSCFMDVFTVIITLVFRFINVLLFVGFFKSGFKKE